jgi:hypothetical protein
LILPKAAAGAGAVFVLVALVQSTLAPPAAPVAAAAASAPRAAGSHTGFVTAPVTDAQTGTSRYDEAIGYRTIPAERSGLPHIDSANAAMPIHLGTPASEILALPPPAVPDPPPGAFRTPYYSSATHVSSAPPRFRLRFRF